MIRGDRDLDFLTEANEARSDRDPGAFASLEYDPLYFADEAPPVVGFDFGAITPYLSAAAGLAAGSSKTPASTAPTHAPTAPPMALRDLALNKPAQPTPAKPAHKSRVALYLGLSLGGLALLSGGIYFATRRRKP